MDREGEWRNIHTVSTGLGRIGEVLTARKVKFTGCMLFCWLEKAGEISTKLKKGLKESCWLEKAGEISTNLDGLKK